MEPRQRRHLLVFETERGLLSLETDDLFEVSEQRWFKEFLNVADIRASSYQQREEEPVPRPRPAPMPVPAPEPVQVRVPSRMDRSFLITTPDQMSKDKWDMLNPDQQQEYIQYYGLEKPKSQ